MKRRKYKLFKIFLKLNLINFQKNKEFNDENWEKYFFDDRQIIFSAQFLISVI